VSAIASPRLASHPPLSSCPWLACPPARLLASQVHYERYQKVTYRCKDGTEKEKKDFVTVTVPFSEWLKELREFWPKFIRHHNDAKWHDDDFAAMRTKLLRGMVCVVIDFAQNYAHEPRDEHQSKYFSQVRSRTPNQHARIATSLTCPARPRAPDRSQVQSTLVPVVLVINVEDLTNITDERRSELVAYFDEHDLPHVVTETHFVISSDLQHDNALIQKIFDDFIMPYIKKNAPSVNELHVRSDGCKVRNCARFLRPPSCVPRLTAAPAPPRGARAAAGPVQVRGQLLVGLAAVQGGLGHPHQLVLLRVVPRQVLLRPGGRHAQECRQAGRAPRARPLVQELGGAVQVGS